MRDELLEKLLRHHEGVHHHDKSPHRVVKNFKIDSDFEITSDGLDKVLIKKNNSHHRNHSSFIILKRWLTAQVGRLWNDVYSELTTHINSTADQTYSISGMIKWHVELNVMIIDGKMYCVKEYRNILIPINDINTLYVHPVTKILLRNDVKNNKKEIRKKAIAELRKRRIIIDKSLQFHNINNCWYRIQTKLRHTDHLVEDALGTIYQTNIGAKNDYSGDIFRNRYGSDKIYGVKKEAASKKDIKKYQLNLD